jgi:hypothetical protein
VDSAAFSLEAVRLESGADLAGRLALWMARGVHEDSDARMVFTSAGELRNVQLAPLYVDLTLARHASFDPPEPEAQPLSFYETLAGDTDSRIQQVSDVPPEQPRRVPPHWVLFGGPGQGKSTLTQWAAIAQWQAALAAADMTTAPALVRLGVDAVRAPDLEERLAAIATRAEAIAWSRRWLAVRVELPAWIEFVSAREEGADFGALCAYLASLHEGVVREEEWRSLLVRWPVLWLFDALDEVSVGAARAQCVAAIDAAITASPAGSRAIVTSRPQGYDGVLGPDCVADPLSTSGPARNAMVHSDDARFLHLFVAPLAPAQVRELSATILKLKFPSQPRDRERVERAIATALEQRASSELLRTPLFVSIVLPIVEASGSVPSSATRLIERLYQFLVERETRKDSRGALHNLLDHYDWAVLALHARVALALQVRAEERGAVTALTVDELRALAESVVFERVTHPRIREQLVSDLLFFAEQRLVLLVQHEVGRVRFDVRLVQEFFASRALFDRTVAGELDRRPELRVERLQLIATHTRWLQVLCFATSSFVTANDRTMLDALLDCLRAANDESGVKGPRELGLARVGAQVAVGLLGNAAVGGDPDFVERLWDIALAFEWNSAPPAGRSYTSVAGAYSESQPELCQRLVAKAVTGWREERAESAIHWLTEIAFAAGDRGALAAIEEISRTDERARDWVFGSTIWMMSPTSRHRSTVVVEWLRRMLATQPDAVDPISASANLLWFWRDADPSQLTKALAQLGNRHAVVRATGPAGSQVRLFSFIPLSDTVRWQQLQAQVDLASLGWPRLRAVMSFAASPSIESLAAAILAFRGADEDAIEAASGRVPWPLAGLLHRAMRVESIEALAADVERGAFGDPTSWRALENTVSASEFDLRSCPLDAHSDAVQALWLEGLQSQFMYSADELASWADAAPLERLASAINDGSRAAAAMLRWVLPDDSRETALAGMIAASAFPRLYTNGAVDAAALFAFLPLDPARASDHLTALDALVEVGSPRMLTGDSVLWFEGDDSAIDAATEWLLRAAKLHSNPSIVFLLDALAAVRLSEHNRRSVLGLPRTDATALPWAALQVRGRQDDPERLAEAIALLSQPTSVAAAFRQSAAWSLSLVSGRGEDCAARARIALLLLESCPADDRSTRGAIARTLSWAALFRDGPFALPEARARAGLPLPTAAAPATAPSPDGIVALREVSLSNLRCIEGTRFTVRASSDPDRGQWIVLLGDNGVGKTTLLRALALALVKPAYVPRGPDSDTLRALRRGSTAGEVRIKFDLGASERETHCRFSLSDDRTERWEPLEQNARPFVVGYGVFRTVGDVGSGVTSTVNEQQAILSLLSPRYAVLSAREWLNTLGEEADVIGGAVRQALTDALRPAGVEDVRVSLEHGFTVSGPAVGEEIPLGSLSDGYLSTTGWIVDVMARWVAAARREQRPLVRNFHHHMTGVVLIDEIDQHLHPRWQRDLIQTVRKVFPRLSFVATTHNPLTVLELDEGELFGLRRDEQRRVVVEPLPPIHGLMTDRVLTGAWFSLGSTLDDETLSWMEEHRRLLRDDPDSPRRRELEEKLRERTGRYAELSIERLALGVAQQLMDEDHERWSRAERSTPAEREALRASLLERVREKLRERGETPARG